jgi:hypothetical protein
MTDVKETKISVDEKEEDKKGAPHDRLDTPGACIELKGWPVYDKLSGFAGILEPTPHDVPPPDDFVGTNNHALDEYVLNHLPLTEEQKADLIKQLLADQAREKGIEKKEKELSKNRHLSKTRQRSKGGKRDGIKIRLLPDAQTKQHPRQEKTGIRTEDYTIRLRSDGSRKSETKER